MDGKIYAHYPEKWEKAKVVYSDKQLKTFSIKNGIILPPVEKAFSAFIGGVYDENKKYIAGLIRNNNKHGSGWELNDLPWPSGLEVKKRSKETVIFGGASGTHFGHFILDGMNRLWHCLQNENEDYRIVYLLIPMWHKYEWLWDFFSLLNIPKERVLILTEPTKFDRIIIPEESAHTSLSLYTEKYLLPFRFIVSNAGTPCVLKKIYLAKNSSERLRGEDYFLKFFQERGFVPIRPETLSVKDQVRLMAGAEEVVCTMGTISHLAMFCKPGIKFTILTHVDGVLQPQALINKASNVRWIIVDVSQNLFFATYWRGVNLVGPNRYWKKYVKEEWGEEIEECLNKEDCYRYLRDICKYYEAAPHNFFLDAENNNPYAVFSRLFHVLLDKDMDYERFNYDSYKNERLKEKKYKNLLEAWNKLLGTPAIEADVHVSLIGWMMSRYDRVLGNGKNHIEALRIRFPDGSLSVRYATYTSKYGWGNEMTNGEMTGSVGNRLPLAGIYIKIDELQNRYSIYYRIMGENGRWSSWAKDGEKIFSESGLAMIALEINLIKKCSDVLKDYQSTGL